MAHAIRWGSRLLVWVAVGTVLGACSERRIIGEQCPSPFSGHATIEGDAGDAVIYGTSCAPCDKPHPKLDARGCPIFVTFESCGGDICAGGVRISRIDAGTEEDGGAEDGGGEEDGGAR